MDKIRPVVPEIQSISTAAAAGLSSGPSVAIFYFWVFEVILHGRSELFEVFISKGLVPLASVLNFFQNSAVVVDIFYLLVFKVVFHQRLSSFKVSVNFGSVPLALVSNLGKIRSVVAKLHGIMAKCAKQNFFRISSIV